RSSETDLAVDRAVLSRSPFQRRKLGGSRACVCRSWPRAVRQGEELQTSPLPTPHRKPTFGWSSRFRKRGRQRVSPRQLRGALEPGQSNGEPRSRWRRVSNETATTLQSSRRRTGPAWLRHGRTERVNK